MAVHDEALETWLGEIGARELMTFCGTPTSITAYEVLGETFLVSKAHHDWTIYVPADFSGVTERHLDAAARHMGVPGDPTLGTNDDASHG